MAAAADDLTDADFFDRLVDDDAPAPAPAPAPGPAVGASAPEEEEELVRAVSGLGLAGGGEGPGPSSSAGAAEGGRAAAVHHTTVKQVQWASFGGDGDDDDPFGDLAAGAGEAEAFLGTADQASGSSAVGGGADHGLLGGTQSSAQDQGFFGVSSDQSTATQQLEDTGAVADLTTDPKYLESIYPGWKFDEATQQWYQVDAAQTTAGYAAQVDENAQQFGASYLQNSAQAALEPIAEESAAATGGAASEYPANMLFYAEYPGWYFDTDKQE